MLLTYKYRIYPSNIQQHNLAIHFGHNRFIWNEALRFIQTDNNGKYTSKEKLHLRLPVLKKNLTWLKDAHSQTLQATIKRLDIAFQRFFKKQAGYPKIKKRNTEQSIEFPQSSQVDFNLNCIRIPKIGYVRAKLHRKFTGKIRTCYISKSSAQEYYACFVIEDGIIQPKVNTDVKLTGIDLGVKTLVIDSYGNTYENNKPLKKKLKKIKSAQKTMARRKKKKKIIVVHENMYGPFSKTNPLQSFTEEKEIYSKRYIKAKQQVARLHRDVVNCRNDYLHKVSKALVDNHDGIAAETLNVRGMAKNHKLAQSILDCAWGKLISLCEYKSARAGKVFVKIGTFFASSKLCSTCGHKYHGLTLNERTWCCENCGTKHDRDINAAINIATEGERIMLEMIEKGEFKNQEPPRKTTSKRYGKKKKKESVLDSDVSNNTAGLAERGGALSREVIPARPVETCQETYLVI